MKKTNNKKHLEELVSLIMYTRQIDKNNKFGVIDKEQINYEKKINEESKCLIE